MPEEYLPSIIEKLAPFMDDYQLCELKIQQLKSKGFKDNKHLDLLEDASANAQIEMYNICQKNQ